MNITTFLYGRGAQRAAPRTVSRELAGAIWNALRDDQVHIHMFEHTPILNAQFREIHVSSPRLRPLLEMFGGVHHEIAPMLRIINGHCTVDEVGFNPRDNSETLRVLRDRIYKVATEKAQNIIAELSLNCSTAIGHGHEAVQPIINSILGKGTSLTISNKYASPRLGFREELPFLLLDNDHAGRMGVQGLKGFHSPRRHRFVITDGTFYLIGQGDGSSIKSIKIAMRQPNFAVSGLLRDTWGETLVTLETCHGETARDIGFHLRETCRAQLLAVSNKIV